jgi:hypothetical protein
MESDRARFITASEKMFRLDQISRHGILPRVMAAEPPNRAIDQIVQFVVGNSHFL